MIVVSVCQLEPVFPELNTGKRIEKDHAIIAHCVKIGQEEDCCLSLST